MPFPGSIKENELSLDQLKKENTSNGELLVERTTFLLSRKCNRGRHNSPCGSLPLLLSRLVKLPAPTEYLPQLVSELPGRSGCFLINALAKAFGAIVEERLRKHADSPICAEGSAADPDESQWIAEGPDSEKRD